MIVKWTTFVLRSEFDILASIRLPWIPVLLSPFGTWRSWRSWDRNEDLSQGQETTLSEDDCTTLVDLWSTMVSGCFANEIAWTPWFGVIQYCVEEHGCRLSGEYGRRPNHGIERTGQTFTTRIHCLVRVPCVVEVLDVLYSANIDKALRMCGCVLSPLQKATRSYQIDTHHHFDRQVSRYTSPAKSYPQDTSHHATQLLQPQIPALPRVP